jgi:hypothetical protein
MHHFPVDREPLLDATANPSAAVAAQSEGKPASLSILSLLRSSDVEAKRGMRIVVTTQLAQQFSGGSLRLSSVDPKPRLISRRTGINAGSCPRRLLSRAHSYIFPTVLYYSTAILTSVLPASAKFVALLITVVVRIDKFRMASPLADPYCDRTSLWSVLNCDSG